MRLEILMMICALLLISGCATQTTTPITENAPIKIGWIGPLTGAGALYGTTELNAAKLAVEDLNAAGGINGRAVELIVEDGKCEGATAASAATKLIEVDGVHQILGGHCSTESLSILPITEPNKVFVIAGATGTDVFTGAGKYSFRTFPSAKGLYGKLAEAAYKKGSRKAAMIAENKDWPKAVVGGFEGRFKEIGGEIVASETFPPGETDFRTMLLKIKQSNPDSIMISAQGPDADAGIISQMAELGMDMQIYGDVIAVSKGVYDKTGGKLPSTAIAGLPLIDPSTSPKAQDVLDRFTKRFGAPPFGTFHPLESYDGVMVMADVIKQCGDDADRARNLMVSKEWDGVTGKVSFNEKGDIKADHFSMARVVDGEVVFEGGEGAVLSTKLSGDKAIIRKAKIGVIAPLTGDLAEFGIAFKNGITLAQEEIGCGKDLEFSYEDGKYDPKATITAFRDLTEVKNVDLVLNWGALPANVISPIAKETDTSLINYQIDRPPKESRGKNILRGSGDPDRLSLALLQHLRTIGAKKIGIINLQNPYIEALTEGMISQKAADETVTVIDTVQFGETDLKGTILKAKQSGTQAIAVFLFPGQLSQFYKQMDQLGFHVPTVGSDGLESQQEIDNSAGTMNGAVYSNWHFDPAFEKRYSERFGNQNQIAYAAGGYDLCGMIAKADFTAKENIIPSIERIKDYKGVEGTLGFANKDGDRFLDLSVDLKGVENNTVVVKQSEAVKP